MRRDSFQAIADPTRRAIIQKLAGRPMNLNEIAEHFDISRPAISKQIKILAECGMIRIKKEGRERFCEVQIQKLDEVSDWIEKYRIFWARKMDDLEQFLMKDKKRNSIQFKKSKNE